MKYPEEIDVGQLADACTAFMEALGLDPMGAYFPLHIDSDKVTFPAVIEGCTRMSCTSCSLDPNGDYPEHSEASVQVEIKVAH